MSNKKNTQAKLNTQDVEVLAEASEPTVTLNPETPKQPTYDERLADFLNSYGKLIAVDFTELAELVGQLSTDISAGNVAEHADVVTAKEAIADLEAQKLELGSVPESLRKYAEIGLNKEIAAHAATIESHKDDNPVHRAMLERVFFTLFEQGKIKFGKTSKPRAKGNRTSKPQIGDTDVWPFSYKTKRTLKDGTEFEVPLTEGFVFGPSHPKVIEANVLNPSDKVIVTTREGLIMGHLSKALSKSALLGQSVAIVGGLDETAPAKVSETGISAFDNGRTSELAKSIPMPHVAIVANGKNSENKAVGARELAETA